MTQGEKTTWERHADIQANISKQFLNLPCQKGIGCVETTPTQRMYKMSMLVFSSIFQKDKAHHEREINILCAKWTVLSLIFEKYSSFSPTQTLDGHTFQAYVIIIQSFNCHCVKLGDLYIVNS